MVTKKLRTLSKITVRIIEELFFIYSNSIFYFSNLLHIIVFVYIYTLYTLYCISAALLEDVAQNADLYILLPIKTSIVYANLHVLRCIACVQTCIALNDVVLVLGISS